MSRAIGPLKFGVISQGAGTTAIVAAITGVKIRLVSYTLVCTGAATALFESGTTNLTGTMSFAANGGVTAYCPDGLFEAAAGEALNLTTATSAVEGHFTYRELR